jgi:glyoxylase-like metal-dependent hydrolase (beta-lactamase superfamily II)
MSNHSLIVDPGDWGQDLGHWVESLCPRSHHHIFLTHGHVDHMCGISDMCTVLGRIPIFCSERDLGYFLDPEMNRCPFNQQSGSLSDHVSQFSFVEPGHLRIGEDLFEVLALPGHTPGSIGLYSRYDKCVFTGDILFRGSIGTAHGPKSDFWSLIRSIRQVLFHLPDDTIVYPGHGPQSTIGHEKATNPFLSYKP